MVLSGEPSALAVERVPNGANVRRLVDPERLTVWLAGGDDEVTILVSRTRRTESRPRCASGSKSPC
jgi:hypothetical protein